MPITDMENNSVNGEFSPLEKTSSTPDHESITRCTCAEMCEAMKKICEDEVEFDRRVLNHWIQKGKIPAEKVFYPQAPGKYRYDIDLVKCNGEYRSEIQKKIFEIRETKRIKEKEKQEKA